MKEEEASDSKTAAADGGKEKASPLELSMRKSRLEGDPDAEKGSTECPAVKSIVKVRYWAPKFRFCL